MLLAQLARTIMLLFERHRRARPLEWLGHVIDLVAGRDFTPDGTIEAADVRDGDACPNCAEGTLASARGIEMGHIFQLGRKYAEALDLKVLDENGKLVTVTMGSYGIGVSRAVAAIAENTHDDLGLVWPREVAPADVHLVATGKDEAVFEAAERLADGSAMDVWKRMIRAQGGDPAAPLPQARESQVVTATATGVLTRLGACAVHTGVHVEQHFESHASRDGGGGPGAVPRYPSRQRAAPEAGIRGAVSRPREEGQRRLRGRHRDRLDPVRKGGGTPCLTRHRNSRWDWQSAMNRRSTPMC